MSITTAQIRGARGILNWSQQDLAQRTGISATSIGAIENGSTTPRASTVEIIKKTFEQNGVEFLGMDGIREQTEKVKTFYGSEGFREFMDLLYQYAKNYGGDIVLFNAFPPNWYKWLGEDWFNMHSQRMQDLGDKIEMRITSKEGENLFISKGFAEYKWFPEQLFNDRSMYAFGNNLAFVNFEEDDVSILLLKQEHFANAFRVLFDIAWNNVALTPSTENTK